MTKAEQAIIDNMPSHRPENKEQCEIDVMTDGSSTYWMDKRYLKEQNAGWYFEWDKGIRWDSNDRMMWNKNVKGELELEYELI